MDRWASFDCYGTLIDWDGGIRAELARVFGEDDADAKLARYHEVEPRLQSDGSSSYRQVLTGAMLELGAPPGEEHGLADSLPAWPAFADVRVALEEARRRGWKLAILSNTDDDFIAASQVRVGVRFDEVVVAQEIGSYKPARRHWDELFERTRLQPDRYVHVAASRFHDIAPCAQLGLTCVWINRLGEPAPDQPPTRELTGLRDLPEVLDQLVPA